MSMGEFLFSVRGRIGRQPFWLFVLALVAASLAVGRLAAVLDVPVLPPVFDVAMLWPAIAVSAKRWHDRDKSAWWMLIGLIPIVGPIWAMVETGFLGGTPGPNRFGPPPA